MMMRLNLLPADVTCGCKIHSRGAERAYSHQANPCAQESEDEKKFEDQDEMELEGETEAPRCRHFDVAAQAGPFGFSARQLT